MRRMIQIFPVIFGSSVLAIYLLDLLFGDWAATYHIYLLAQAHDILVLLVISVLTGFMQMIFYSKKELSRRQMYWRYVLRLPATLAIVIPIAAIRGWIRFNVPVSVAILIGVVVVIYLMTVVADIHAFRKLADQLNQELKERYDER